MPLLASPNVAQLLPLYVLALPPVAIPVNVILALADSTSQKTPPADTVLTKSANTQCPPGIVSVIVTVVEPLNVPGDPPLFVYTATVITVPAAAST